MVVVLVAVALVLVMARAGAALGASAPGASERHPARTSPAAGAVTTGAVTTVVRPGDSLWTVAERLTPGDDPRPTVDALSDARHGTVLIPGETISWEG